MEGIEKTFSVPVEKASPEVYEAIQTIIDSISVANLKSVAHKCKTVPLPKVNDKLEFGLSWLK